MKSQILPISDLPNGIYQTEIVELSTVRRPFLLIVWVLEVKYGDFSGNKFKYSYRANESPERTSENFQAVGITQSNLQAVLEDSELIRGVKVKVAIEEKSIRFLKSGEFDLIEPGKFLKSPF